MEALKDIYFQKEFVEKLSSEIKVKTPDFDSEKFESKLLDSTFTSLELKEKLRKTAEVLGECFTLNFEDELSVLKDVAPQFNDFESMVFPEFVDVYGQGHFDLSLEALSYFTQFGSSEFAIRSFMNKDVDKVMAYMYELAKHKHPYVRRFATEGCRPKLPWAKSVKALNDKSYLLKIIEILDLLKNDPSEFVRKSVANNLNDISKLDPDLVLDKAYSWHGQTKETDWILKHGLRTLLKKGNKKALELWGVNDASHINVQRFEFEEQNQVIGKVSYLTVRLKVDQSKRVRGAYVLHYLKKRGQLSPKTFSFFEKDLEKGEHEFRRKVNFKDMSTRTHISGVHKVDMVVNGDVLASFEFVLGDS